jgi:hypothetical protein
MAEREEGLKSLWWDERLKELFLEKINEFFHREKVRKAILGGKDGVMEKKMAALLQRHLASELPQVDGRDLSWRVLFSGPQKFPDLRVELNDTLYFAIELKKSESAQSIPGNSVAEVGRFLREWFAVKDLGLESPEDFIELLHRTYLVFVFGEKGNAKVVVGPYFDHVSGARVTHSPRYLITAHSSEEGKFHEELRSGLLKQLSSENVKSENVKSEILRRAEEFFRDTQYKLVVLDYFRKVEASGGGKPPHVSQHLLTEGPTAEDSDEEFPLAISAERNWGLFKNPDPAEKSWLRALTFVLVPDVLGGGQSKYHLVEAVWFLKGYYLHNLRDAFSAGGQVNRTPRVWHHFLRTSNQLFVETIKEVYEENMWRDFWRKQGISTGNINEIGQFGDVWKKAVLDRVEKNPGKRSVRELKEEVRRKAEEIIKETKKQKKRKKQKP